MLTHVHAHVRTHARYFLLAVGQKTFNNILTTNILQISKEGAILHRQRQLATDTSSLTIL